MLARVSYQEEPQVAHHVLENHGTFEQMKLGRSAVSHDPRMLKLGSYLDDEVVLPKVPDEFDLGGKVTTWPMYRNDEWGDCTCAAVGHMIQAWTSHAGAERTPAEDVIERLYIPETGDADEGRVEIDVLNYWRKSGVDGDKIDAYVSVKPSNHDHVKAGAYLFGGLYIGVALPLTAQSQHVWDYVADSGDQGEPGSWGGHAVDVVAYDADTLTVVTWGGLLKMTWAFWDHYVDESYALLSPDLLSGDKTPEGFDAEALRADLAAL